MTVQVPAATDDREELNVVPVQPNNCIAYRFVKRTCDLVGAILAGMLLLIPMLAVALLIRLESSGPAIFKQLRMGKNEKIFVIYKFRTMRMDAPPELATREFLNSDQYITKVGAFLRRTSMDELPQLFNILKGDMSFVGYRPVCVTETKLNALRKQYGVFSVRPGLTGYAQVLGRDNIDYQKKAALDAEYVKNRNVMLDLWCLIKTVAVVFTGEGMK
jgi:O-antigen biosynthesis protein WbqP